VILRIIFIDTDGKYCDALVLEVGLHLHQRRRLLNARRTPRRPEIQHHHLPAKLAQRDFMIGILHREVGSIRPNSRRTIPAVASNE